MTKNTLPKFLIGASLVLFIYELLDFEYDKPSDGAIISLLMQLLSPVLIILSMWLLIRSNYKGNS